MKYTLLHVIRFAGLLRLADYVKYMWARIKTIPQNRAFVRAHPDFPVPPPALAFDAYNHVRWPEYHEVGLRHAKVFADLIRSGAPAGPLSILEWGCGPARLIRHLPTLLEGYDLRLVGTDYNRETIAWCQRHLPNIEFVLNDLNPPLPFPDDSFDVTYNFSVFTHLSEAVQKAWAAELWRVLKPGGRLICTTHGDYYRYLLASRDEATRYAAGEVVTQQGYEEGKKWFFAIHPPEAVKRDLLQAFEGVRKAEVPGDATLYQDIWIAEKPLSRQPAASRIGIG